MAARSFSSVLSQRCSSITYAPGVVDCTESLILFRMFTRLASYAESCASLLDTFWVNPFVKSRRNPSILYSFNQKSVTRSIKYWVAAASWLKSYPKVIAACGAIGLNHGLSGAGRLLKLSQYILTIGDCS